MGISHSGGSPNSADDLGKTPPLRTGGRSLMRAIAIVSVFVFAGSMTLWVRPDFGDGPIEWWIELLVVPAFFIGLLVATTDYLWQRRH